MTMRHRIQINLDCHDLDAIVDFWGPALGYELAGETGPYKAVGDPAGHGPDLVFQQVPEQRTVKNRMHLDLYVQGDDTLESEQARLEELGATVHPDGRIDEDNEEWVVMVDPKGNEFCICHR